MGYEDLLRIYETFAQPLEKRGTKRSLDNTILQPIQSGMQPYPTSTQFNDGFQAHRMVPCYKINEALDVPASKYLKLSFNTLESVAKKRSNCIAINAAQEATPTKRKPIAWP